MSTLTSQAEQIEQHLRAHPEGITPLDAMRLYQCMRLGARIWDLRRQGLPITRDLITTPTGKHVARYRLAPINPANP